MASINAADLAVFLAIAEHGSFRRAADQLSVTASALSHALRGVEERAGVRLFNRTTRSVALTEAGARLFERISPAFRDIDDALEDLNSFRGKPAGTLRVNAARQSAQLVLLPIVTKFLKAFPDVNVEIVVNDALIDMVSLCGPRDAVRDRLAAFRDAGVGTLTISAMAWTTEERIEQLRAVAELVA